MTCCQTLFLTVGFAVVCRFIISFVREFYKIHLRPGKNVKQYGPWVVITGATDGIGKSYANALANKGLNIILISRTQSKLDEFASDLKSKYNVEVKTLAINFISATVEDYNLIRQTFASHNVGLLINNVGMSYDHVEYFGLIDDGTAENVIQVNVNCLNKMTKIAIESFKTRKGKKLILNIGSAVGTTLPSCAFTAIYAASKKYVDNLTKSLKEEYKAEGIEFQNHAPMFVATKMSKIRKTSFTIPSSDDWVKGSLKQLGYEVYSSPYWTHAWTDYVASFLPEQIVNHYHLQNQLDLRKRYYKKMERLAASK